jgi:hypothetical protein
MTKLIKILLPCLAIAFIVGVLVGRSRGIPFVKKERNVWSIGIYMGDSPFSLSSPGRIKNPVLTNEDVTDVHARFVADPFMLKKDSIWYMFFEVMNAKTGHGDIGLAISTDVVNWTYKQIVLDEPFHLSYPYVFEWKNQYYMIPESREANSIRIYKATKFPIEWSYAGDLLEGDFADSSLCYFKGMWWIFAETNPIGHDTLSLYYADSLMGPYTEHPDSPIIMGDANIARPGGRVFVFEDRIVRYTQDDDPTYGKQVRAFKITKLTTKSYEEELVSDEPILKPSGVGWNGKGMHHIDPHQIENDTWIACVDGYGDILSFGFRY